MLQTLDNFLLSHWVALGVFAYIVSILTEDDASERTLRLLVHIDVVIFSIATRGRSKRNETMSSAAWDMYEAGKWQGRVFCPFIDWLFSPWEKNHCYTSWLVENKQQLWNRRYE